MTVSEQESCAQTLAPSAIDEQASVGKSKNFRRRVCLSQSVRNNQSLRSHLLLPY